MHFFSLLVAPSPAPAHKLICAPTSNAADRHENTYNADKPGIRVRDILSRYMYVHAPET